MLHFHPSLSNSTAYKKPVIIHQKEIFKWIEKRKILFLPPF